MTAELKKILLILGAIGTLLTSIASAGVFVVGYLDTFQTKKDATLLHLDSMIHSDVLHLASFDSDAERGIILTRTEIRTYNGLVSSIERMRSKQEELLGL